MLRITIDDSSSVATLKVEGKLTGAWAMELGNTWEDLWASVRQKPLRVDLRDVSFVDSCGDRILRQIVRATGAELCAERLDVALGLLGSKRRVELVLLLQDLQR